jgi:hypothetical protein
MEIELTLRISHSSDELLHFVAQNGISMFSSLGRVSTHQDRSVIVINIDVAPEDSLDEVLGKGVAIAAAARSVDGLPADAALSLWTVISASKEFVGIVVQEGIVRSAAQARVSLVFSVYYVSSVTSTRGTD